MIKERLKQHFDPKDWNGYKSFNSYPYTGKNLIEEINLLDPDMVIDVGCGHNRFKGHIKGLIGFDQSDFPYVDIVADIDHISFRKECADVILCLGSVQFGDRANVIRQMQKITSWLKPGGFIVMRTMNEWFHPGREYVHWDHQYKWTREDVTDIGKELNLELYKGIWDELVPSNEKGRKAGYQWKSSRLSWWYKKPGILKKYSINVDTCNIEER